MCRPRHWQEDVEASMGVHVQVSFPNSASHKGAFMARFPGMVSFLVVSIREAETPAFLSSQPHKGEFMRFPLGQSILRFKRCVEGSFYHA